MYTSIKMFHRTIREHMSNDNGIPFKATFVMRTGKDKSYIVIGEVTKEELGLDEAETVDENIFSFKSISMGCIREEIPADNDDMVKIVVLDIRNIMLSEYEALTPLQMKYINPLLTWLKSNGQL